MMFDTSFVVGVVEVFDGSTIVDPVVVSDVFWASLRGKVVAVVIGQVLATIAFGIFSWFLSSQISQLFDRVASTFSKGTTQQDPPSKFIKANEIRSFYRPPPDFGKLLICLAIDVIGSSSEVIPFLGEITDVIYAPIAATILRNLYGSNILFGLEFVEEILPFTDVLPLATICWVIDTFLPESDIAKLLQLGVYNSKAVSEGAIDINVEAQDPPKWKKERNDR